MIIHEPPYDGPNPTFEYLLPFRVEEIEESRRAFFTPWFTRFEGLNSAEVGALLAEDWQTLEGDSIRSLCDYLQELRPKSISIDYNHIWLCLQHPVFENSEFTICEPRSLTDEQRKFVEGFSHPELCCLSEQFYNCNEGIDSWSCSGLQVEAKPRHGENEGEMGEWEGGMILYLIPCGDFLIMNQEQKVGRWFHEVAWDSTREGECAVNPIADSLGAFMAMYLEYLQMPFDARKDTFFH